MQRKIHHLMSLGELCLGPICVPNLPGEHLFSFFLVVWLKISEGTLVHATKETLCVLPAPFPAKTLTKKHCHELSKFILRTWKLAAILLGFDVSYLTEIEANHYDHCRMQAAMIFTKWTQREVKEENLNNLIPIFEMVKTL